jgi:hypothetical protein
MLISKTYCDLCGKLVASFADQVTVLKHDMGMLSFDLCWECGAEMYKRLSDLKAENAKHE